MMLKYLPWSAGPHDIYIVWCYLASAVLLIGLALLSWRTKRNDERILRKLEKQIRDLSNNKVE